MKLTAAILFAATNAQRDGGRVRDKEVSTEDSAFADYFGSNFDYNGAYDTGFDASAYESFGDDSAFGDLNFGSYDDSYSADAAADDEGRPIDVVDDEEKSTFEDGNIAAVALESIDTVFSERCYNSVGTDKASWLTNGSWERCNGETEACEVKVVRRGGAITQIHSKCANQFSCISNMRQNFNPKKLNAGTSWYTLYNQQACRPLQMPGFSGDIGPRIQKTDSTCFFCVEPCRSAAVTNFDGAGATVASENAVRDANCIGKSHTTGHGNSKPIASRDDVDLMAGEDKLVANPAGETANPTAINFYSTVAQTMQVTIDGHIYKDNRIISYIQKEQKTFTG